MSHAVNSIVTEEIDRFNKLADSWWDEAGPMWPLHRLNALRAPFINGHIRRHFELVGPDRPVDLDILDIGCGAGLLSESMAKTGARVLGIDAAEKNIQMAKRHAAGAGLSLDYQHSTVETLGRDRQFDVVLNMEVVEHVSDVHSFLTDCAELVRPGGLLFIATINRTIYSAVTAIVGAEYILGWLPKGTHQWRKFVKPVEIEDILNQQEYQLIETTGVAVNPTSRSMSLSRYLGGNYMLVATRCPSL